MVTNGKKEWIPQLKTLWHTTYGDNEEEINHFFQVFFDEKACWCYVAEGRPVSVIYGIPGSVTIIKGVLKRPVWYLYAGATAVEFRSHGYYRQVMERAVSALNQTGDRPPLILLVPAGGLEPYYEKIGFQTALREERVCFTQEDLGKMNPESVKRLDASQYRGLRNRLFGGTGYVEWGERFLTYAISTVEREAGAALEVVIRGRNHILLARPCGNALIILETSMDMAELEECGKAIAADFGCDYIIKEGITVMSVGKTGLDRLYFRIALDS